MRGQVIVATRRDPLQLRPAKGKLVLDVERAARVVGELVLAMRPQPQVIGLDPEPAIPAESLLRPVLEPLHLVGGRHEILELHLLELAEAKDGVARRDLVAKRLADLRDAKGRAHPRRVEDVGEVDEDPLGGLRPQVDLRARVLNRPGEGLEHQVELPRFGELAAVFLVSRPTHLVGAEALVTFLALEEWVGEVLDVTGRHPDLRVHENAGIDTDDVVAQLDHAAPPGTLDIVAQRDSQRAEVVHALDAAVDLARLIEKAPPLRERDELLHQAPTLTRGGGIAPTLTLPRKRGRDVCLRHQRIDRMNSMLFRWRSRWYSSCASSACSTSWSKSKERRSRS